MANADIPIHNACPRRRNGVTAGGRGDAAVNTSTREGKIGVGVRIGALVLVNMGTRTR